MKGFVVVRGRVKGKVWGGGGGGLSRDKKEWNMERLKSEREGNGRTVRRVKLL